MVGAVLKIRTGASRARGRAPALLAVAVACVTLAACGSNSSKSGSGTGGSSNHGSKLIVAAMGFPCSLNDFAKSLCAGFRAGEQALPPGFTFQLKTGTDYADQTGFNNLIQTSTQLNPGGLIVFPSGPAAQAPVVKQACAKGVKVIIIDNPINGLGSCQSSYIAANNRTLGRLVGTWLTKHPPASKQVGIVSFPPGQESDMDARVNGFKEVVEAAGFKVVAMVPTDLTLDKTRTQVTNMLTAHPGLGAILSANDQLGYGTAQAVAHSSTPRVVQLSIDGALDAVKRIPGGLSADAAQDPYFAGRQSVLNMAKLLQGSTIPPVVDEATQLIDATNAKAYIQAGGAR